MVKQEVLAALDAVRGRYISGQELAAQLGVSRTAVWKAVAALRSDGIPIEAVTNRGYPLAADADVLNGFMRTNITTGGLIHLPFSDFDNIGIKHGIRSFHFYGIWEKRL